MCWNDKYLIPEKEYPTHKVVWVKLSGSGGGTWWPGYVVTSGENGIQVGFWSEDDEQDV